MNRTDFMRQLESLLQNISASEREEALQYYNDYFDDAGPENEQKVIADLGTPARVAENIRRELAEGQSAKKPTAADGVLIEYGKGDAGRTAGNPGWEASGGSGGFGSGGAAGSGGNSGTSGKSGMSGGMVALIVILAVIASPILVPLALGLFLVVFWILMALFILIFAFGVTSLALFVAFLALLIVGGMCIPVDPLAGIAVMGAGFVCGGVGMLFLMLTVAMAGIVAPACFRGIGHLFLLGRREARA